VSGVILITACVMIGLSVFSSVNERKNEIGLLRAVGFSKKAVFVLMNLEGLLLGCVAAVIGYCAGFAASFRFFGLLDLGDVAPPVFDPVAVRGHLRGRVRAVDPGLPAAVPGRRQDRTVPSPGHALEGDPSMLRAIGCDQTPGRRLRQRSGPARGESDIGAGGFRLHRGPVGLGQVDPAQCAGNLAHPGYGEIRYEERNLSRLPGHELDRCVPRTFPWSFRCTICFPICPPWKTFWLPFLKRLAPVSAATRAKALECLDRVGLTDKAGRLPGRLSGGEQQRVAIARALVTGPRIIFADEPTGSLDRATGNTVMDLLRALNAEGITVVMVTHEPRYASMASRVVEIEDGRVRQAQ